VLQGASDVTLVKKASTWWYAWLLRNNIEIYEWDKTVLHGKMTLVDDKWATLGSYNVNHLSDYASIETNVEVNDLAFCNNVKEEMERVLSLSTHITSSDYHHKMGIFQQISCWFSFHLIRLLFGLQVALLSKE
jgi:cardiolipin synthase